MAEVLRVSASSGNENGSAEHLYEDEEKELDEEARDQSILKFLDSADRYLTLYDSLSSILRQTYVKMGINHAFWASHNYPAEIAKRLVILDEGPSSTEVTFIVDKQVEEERLKSLKVFGTLVSPKLRAAQITFESVLDILVEIANMRSKTITAYNEVRKETRKRRNGEEDENTSICS